MNPPHLDATSKMLFAISAAAIAAFVYYFTELAKPHEGDRLTRTWATGAADREAASASEPCQFVDVTAACGVHFNHAARSSVRDIRDVMGSGVAIEDLDQDGDLDVFFVNCGTAPGTHHELYLNRGNGTFELAPDSCGLSTTQFGTGCVAADVNKDGKIDLLVTGLDETRLYLNTGLASGLPVFRDVGKAAGLEQKGFATAAAFNDLDLDGDLDLVIVRYLTYEERPAQPLDPRNEPGEFVPRSFRAESDLLYENHEVDAEGIPHFRLLADSDVVQERDGKGLGVLFTDLDLDRQPEIYVANDVSENKLFVNQGRGILKFASALGNQMVDDTRSGMGLELADVDDDGRPDVFATYWQNESNAFYHNESSGGAVAGELNALFSDRSANYGLSKPIFQGRVGWGTVVADFDLDGLVDIVIGNGYTSPARNDAARMTCVAQQPQLYFGERRRERPWFREASAGGGKFLAQQLNARGVAAGDLDEDGDLDLVITQNHGPALVLRNNTRSGRGWLKVHLVPHASAANGIGAQVVAHIGDRHLHRWVVAGESYLSHSSFDIEFGLGDREHVDGITVLWPSGKTSAVGSARAHQTVAIEEQP